MKSLWPNMRVWLICGGWKNPKLSGPSQTGKTGNETFKASAVAAAGAAAAAAPAAPVRHRQETSWRVRARRGSITRNPTLPKEKLSGSNPASADSDFVSVL